MATEIIEYLFVSSGLDGVERGLDRASGAADSAADSMARLRRSSIATRQRLLKTGEAGRRLSESVRGLEGAGRIFGGTFGEITGVVGDLESVAAGSAGALGPAGLLGAVGLLGAASVPVVLAKGAEMAVSLARGALDARDALTDLGAVHLLDSATFTGLDALSEEVERLDVNLSRIAAETGPALVPILAALANFTERIADAAASPLLDQISKLDPDRFGGAAGGILGAVGGVVAGPVGFTAGAELGSRLGSFLASDTGTGAPESRRSLADLVSDLTKDAKEREAASRAASSELAKIGFDTGPRFKMAMRENILEMIEFSGVYGGVREALESNTSIIRRSTERLAADMGAALASFGAGRQGGRNLAQSAVGSVLGSIPVVGGFAEEAIGILVDIRGFLGGFVRGIAQLPVQIVTGIAESIGEIPGLIVAQIPQMVGGLIEGVAQLLLSPVALIDNLIDAVVALPGQIAERLVGLPVRLFRDFLGADQGSGGLFNTGVFDLRPNEGRGGLFGTGALQVVQNRGARRSPAPPPAPAPMRESAPIILLGLGPSSLDELDSAQKFRSGFAGGRP